ncbi:hypothetical protein HYR99_06295 [Candidatus Poribacteria bacterium]|nr:hypothetical protein [Candidatus Poribacteria bacterium]
MTRLIKSPLQHTFVSVLVTVFALFSATNGYSQLEQKKSEATFGSEASPIEIDLYTLPWRRRGKDRRGRLWG